ncbi:Protein of unknown function [Prevotella communis]|uniref:DUF2958 domain-containing protein n=1 Tax=Prevotella communis TaxID=2913614 RepID=A0A1H0GZB7_9BACT|nr:DUF2958 domain-containing protein [Prevotella communis]SDO12267.1 Protein of unknown function [Prevotella communis]
MKLITKEVEKRLQEYPLYSQDGKKKDAICVVKFFMCGVNWTWYILEADLENKIGYGITINPAGEGEYGYVSLAELQTVKNSWGLGVERDIHFDPVKLSEIDDTYLKNFLNNLYSEEE